jgi:predicted phosphodiesterase
MRIGLISDTHIADDLAGFIPEINDAFYRNNVEIILHLGDINSNKVLDVLEKICPVVAVRDFTEPKPLDPRLSETVRVLHIAGKTIAIVHDIGWPGPRIIADVELVLPDGMSLEEILIRKFGCFVDIVAFGHTHQELIAFRENVLFINPGSPNYSHSVKQKGKLGTLGIIDIDYSGNIIPKIIDLNCL